jgi:hypothetical protein
MVDDGMLLVHFFEIGWWLKNTIVVCGGFASGMATMALQA